MKLKDIVNSIKSLFAKITNLALKIEDIKLKECSSFIQSIKQQPQTREALQQEILEENYRLVYVGITRAKIRLYLTCAKTFKMYNKEKTQNPCEIFPQKEAQNEYV